MTGSFTGEQIYGRAKSIPGMNPAIPAIEAASSPLTASNNAVWYWVALVALVMLARVAYEKAG